MRLFFGAGEADRRHRAGQYTLRTVSMVVSGMAAVVAWALPLKLTIVVAIAVAVTLALLIDAQRTPHSAGHKHG